MHHQKTPSKTILENCASGPPAAWRAPELWFEHLSFCSLAGQSLHPQQLSLSFTLLVGTLRIFPKFVLPGYVTFCLPSVYHLRFQTTLLVPEANVSILREWESGGARHSTI